MSAVDGLDDLQKCKVIVESVMRKRNMKLAVVSLRSFILNHVAISTQCVVEVCSRLNKIEWYFVPSRSVVVREIKMQGEIVVQLSHTNHKNPRMEIDACLERGGSVKVTYCWDTIGYFVNVKTLQQLLRLSQKKA